MSVSASFFSRCLCALILGLSVSSFSKAAELPEPFPLPAFTQTEAAAWINTSPLTLEDLEGQVTLIEFWTYGCSNCRRSLPWIASLHERYGDEGLRIIGVHTPEFAWEKPRTAVVAAVKLHGIEYPVMMDNDMQFWRALGNRYWPAFYLVDRQANVVGVYIGETHVDDAQARAVEVHIDELLGR